MRAVGFSWFFERGVEGGTYAAAGTAGPAERQRLHTDPTVGRGKRETVPTDIKASAFIYQKSFLNRRKKPVSISDKIRVVLSIVAAAGLFGVCFVVSNNPAVPTWAQMTVDVLSVLNLVCTIVTAQELVKKGKK